MRSLSRVWVIGALVSLGALIGCSEPNRTFAPSVTGAGGSGGAGGLEPQASSSSSATGAGGVGGEPVSGSGGAGGAGGAAAMNSGDCNFGDNCGKPQICKEVTPGGFRECAGPPLEASMCDNMFDKCCSSAECTTPAKCLETPLVPKCSGPFALKHNECASDECSSDADCAAMGPAICTIAGTLDRKIRACMPVSCLKDVDCTAEPGGICAPVTEPCCTGISGMYCVYPSDGCRANADCPQDYHCGVSNGRASCLAGTIPCPL